MFNITSPTQHSAYDAYQITRDYLMNGLQRLSDNVVIKGVALIGISTIIMGFAAAAFHTLNDNLKSIDLFSDFLASQDTRANIVLVQTLTSNLFFNCVVNHKMNMPYPNLSAFAFTALSVGFLTCLIGCIED